MSLLAVLETSGATHQKCTAPGGAQNVFVEVPKPVRGSGFQAGVCRASSTLPCAMLNCAMRADAVSSTHGCASLRQITVEGPAAQNDCKRVTVFTLASIRSVSADAVVASEYTA